MAVTVGRTKKATHSPTLKIGDTAPDFTLPTHLGNRKGAASDSFFTLSDLPGKSNAVLVFFSLAFTPT